MLPTCLPPFPSFLGAIEPTDSPKRAFTAPVLQTDACTVNLIQDWVLTTLVPFVDETDARNAGGKPKFVMSSTD